MKTTLLQLNTPSLKLISILLLVILNATNLSSQTAINNTQNKPIIIAGVHYHKNTRSATVPSKPKTYSVMAAKGFPIIESGENHILAAMDDSENFNYEELFCNKTIQPAKESAETILLALNF